MKLNTTYFKVSTFSAARDTKADNTKHKQTLIASVLKVNNYFSLICFTKLNITDVKVSIISAASIAQADDTKQK
jgi:hypothetical protein